MLFQEGLRVNWQLNQDSSMIERQAIDLEVRIPVQFQMFFLKFDIENIVLSKQCRCYMPGMRSAEIRGCTLIL